MKNKFDALYKKNSNVWGDKPNKLLLKSLKYLNSDIKEVLDLGCGQGRDALFLASLGFLVTAIDSSQEGINFINAEAKKRKLKIRTSCNKVETIRIPADKFGLIQLNNVLHFLNYVDGLKVIERVKKNITSKGVIIIANFTIFDESKMQKKDKFFLGKNQLQSLFKDKDFDILFYEEKTISNQGHKGDEKPHNHHVAKIIAKKLTK